MRTLYISDLDGTLLHYDERISAKSCEIINALIEKGLLFSYATARSIHTSTEVSRGLYVKLPVIVDNGAFITESLTRKRILNNSFTKAEAAEVYGILQSFDIAPRVDAIIGGAERISYDVKAINSSLASHIASRNKDGRDNPLNDTSVILDGDVFYFTCIGEDDKLHAAYSVLKDMGDKFNSIFQYDIYSGEPWLEILPLAATKANAITQLKKMYNCDEVVVFGDGVNDIPMFQIADRCYAVANATDELKAIATDIIDSNENDGVAHWLLKNINLENSS